MRREGERERASEDKQKADSWWRFTTIQYLVAIQIKQKRLVGQLYVSECGKRRAHQERVLMVNQARQQRRRQHGRIQVPILQRIDEGEQRFAHGAQFSLVCRQE